MTKEFNLSEKITTGFNVSQSHVLMIEDVKTFIKKIEENGEVLKNGAFIINYKKFKELAGEKLV